MDKKVGVEMRLNNTLFLCRVDGKMYNIKDTKAYSVQLMTGLVPAQNQMLINIEAILVCEQCYTDNKGDKGLKLQEPSPIVTAPAGVIPRIKPGMTN